METEPFFYGASFRIEGAIRWGFCGETTAWIDDIARRTQGFCRGSRKGSRPGGAGGVGTWFQKSGELCAVLVWREERGGQASGRSSWKPGTWWRMCPPDIVPLVLVPLGHQPFGGKMLVCVRVRVCVPECDRIQPSGKGLTRTRQGSPARTSRVSFQREGP